jgi:cob(I)alamin adenosyltransferase
VAARGETIPRLYTRTGDGGTTGLAHGARIAKDSPRIEAYGSLDELGAHLGRLAAMLPPNLATQRETVRRLQHQIFVAQSELAVGPGATAPAHVIQPRHVEELEKEIDKFDAQHPELRSFVVPGGSLVAAELHVARTVARRAERELWRLHRSEPLSPSLLQWANRVSDLLFAMALAANAALGVAETAPDYSI